jgi:hypothetical protein
VGLTSELWLGRRVGPPEFDSRCPLREAFLRHFSDEDAERFRYLGNLIYQAFSEGNVLLPKEFEQSGIWREVDAARRDLQFTRHFLAQVAQRLMHFRLDADDARLCLAAAEFSRELGAIADKMEEVLK